MNLKTSLSNLKNGSLFNKAFYKVNIKRFGFVFVLYFVISEVIIDFFYMSLVGSPFWTNGLNAFESKYLFLDYMGYYYFFSVFFIAFVMALVLFSYVNNEKALTSLHAMPVSRRSLYFTNFAVFGSMTGLVLFVHFVFVSMHLVLKGYYLNEFIGYMILKYIVVMVLGLTVFAFTTFIGMLVSNFIIQAGLVFVFLGMPALVVELFKPILGVLINGYTIYEGKTSWDIISMPYYFLFRMMRFFDYGEVDSYAGLELLSFSLAIIILVLSFVFGYILYQKRHLENCHDLIAFKWAKKIITIIISVILALIFANIVGVIVSISQAYKPALFYAGGAIGMFLGYIIMKMISEKSLSIHKFLIGGLISAGIVLITFFIIDLDIPSFEKYVPESSEVETAYVYSSYYALGEKELEEEYGFARNSYSGFGINDNRVIKISGLEDLDKLKDRHLDIVELVNDDNSVITKNFYITYLLKNGKSIRRSYGISEDELIQNIAYFKGFESNKNYLSDDFDRDILLAKYHSGFVYAEGTGMLPLTNKNLHEFLRIYKLDLLDYITDKEQILLESRETIEYESMDILAYVTLIENDSNGKRYEYKIASRFTRTIDWLKQNGYKELFEENKRLDSNNISSSIDTKIIEIFSLDEDRNKSQICKVYDEVMVAKLLAYKEKLSDNITDDFDDTAYIITYQNYNGSVKEMKLNGSAKYLIMSMLEEILVLDDFER